MDRSSSGVRTDGNGSDSDNSNDGASDRNVRGCPKCKGTDVETASMATGDGLVSSLVDLPDAEVTIVSCSACGFSELYRDVGSEEHDPEEQFLQ